MSLAPEDHYENAISELKACIYKLEIQADKYQKRGNTKSYLSIRKQIFRSSKALKILKFPRLSQPVLPQWIEQITPRRRYVRSSRVATKATTTETYSKSKPMTEQEGK